MNKETIDLHIQDERNRLGRNDYYGIREIIQGQLDMQQGIIKSRYLLRKLNQEYDIKHNYNLGFPAKGLEPLPKEEYEGKKIYTIARLLSMYKLLK